ncbi:hypothetical protein A0H81_04210 [Grifola frondosa]|uniref:Uncharacterized protein n=1 Tax=Grifola frondosa TaxID=5627 RepID=A0A1C7MG45_GRIFR|nr:hypothetical protein A0H81_04210 [Grifola frondosa]
MSSTNHDVSARKPSGSSTHSGGHSPSDSPNHVSRLSDSRATSRVPGEADCLLFRYNLRERLLVMCSVWVWVPPTG